MTNGSTAIRGTIPPVQSPVKWAAVKRVIRYFGMSVVFLLAFGGVVTWSLLDVLPPAPEGMVWVPGGELWMGSDFVMFSDAQPVHRVNVEGFFRSPISSSNGS